MGPPWCDQVSDVEGCEVAKPLEGIAAQNSDVVNSICESGLESSSLYWHNHGQSHLSCLLTRVIRVLPRSRTNESCGVRGRESTWFILRN